MEQDPDITLQKITEECQHMLDIKHDNHTIKEKDISCVHAVRPKLKSAKDDIKSSLCYRCSGLHFKKDCYFKNKQCLLCGFSGHKSMQCRRKNKNLEENPTFKNKNIQYPVENRNKWFNDRVKVILSRKEIEDSQKQKYVNIKMDVVNIKLQLDTSSDISIINVFTWKQIGNPLLKIN